MMKQILGNAWMLIVNILLLLLIVYPRVSYGQVIEARVKAALIYNFAKNVEWENERTFASFNIGVISADTSVFIELKQLSKRLKIRNNPINIYRFSSVYEIQNLQMLYIDEMHCSSISEVYDHLQGKRTLLISDKCINSLFIMINILYDNRTQTLSFEINRHNLESEGFALKPEILVHGGSYVDIKKMYIETNNQLREETQKIQDFQKILEAVKHEKDSFQVQANALNKQIVKLLASKDSLENEYFGMNRSLKEKDSLLLIRSSALDKYVSESRILQDKINNQFRKLDETSQNLLRLNHEIDSKQAELEEKQKRIEGQDEILTEKETIINIQKKLIWVSEALALTLILALFLFYRAYRSKKQINLKLEELVDIRTKELQLSREHFKNLFESSPISICDMDLSNFYGFINDLGKTLPKIVKKIDDNPGLIPQAINQIKVNDANSATLKLFGYPTKKDFIDNYSRTFNEISIMDFKQTIPNFITKQVYNSYETVRLTSTGEVKYLQVNWIVLPGFTDNYGRVIVTMADISELKKHRDHLEELVSERSEKIIHLNTELTDTVKELENTVHQLKETQGHLLRSEKMASLGMLTAGIAHEINNPINYISASNQALVPLLDQVLFLMRNTNEDQAEYDELLNSIKFLLENIDTGIKRTTEIIGSLMTYSRTGEMVYNEYNLVMGIKDALVILHSKYANRIVVVENYNTIPLVKCNISSINQVIMNLLSNAIDSIPNKGRIDISLHYKVNTDEVVLSVKDTGVGIPESQKVRIFDPFFTTKEVGKGTGLGLYITYGIVQQHGGRIEVYSDEKQGSEFVVSLPVNAS